MRIFLSEAAFSAYQGVSALVSSDTAKKPPMAGFVIIYVVFGVFVLSGERRIAEFGIGLASARLLDAARREPSSSPA